jgi:hypothetical protein
MPKYRVAVHHTTVEYILVEAEDEQDAIARVESGEGDHDMEEHSLTRGSIEFTAEEET